MLIDGWALLAHRYIGGYMGPEIFIFWLLLAAGVGALAHSRGRSGFGFFLLSVVMSPLIGLIVVLVTKNQKEEEEKERLRVQDHERQLESIKVLANAERGSGTQAAAKAGHAFVADELAKLVELKAKGVLTEEEFLTQKALLLQPSIPEIKDREVSSRHQASPTI